MINVWWKIITTVLRFVSAYFPVILVHFCRSLVFRKTNLIGPEMIRRRVILYASVLVKACIFHVLCEFYFALLCFTGSLRGRHGRVF